MKEFTVQGMLFEIGKNAEENDRLVFHRSAPKDLWFHLEHFPSPHGVLHCKDVEVHSDAIVQCAELVKLHSKHKQAPRVSVSVIEVQYLRRDSSKLGSVVILRSPRILVV